MKVKTSITLSHDLLQAIDSMLPSAGNRSEFIEQALRSHLAHLVRQEISRQDLRILNEHADRLNEEALDTLAYQTGL